jgi:hypothetical protein
MSTHIQEEELSDLADGLLALDRKSAVEAHLASCRECRETAEAYRSLKAGVAALPRSIDPPEQLWSAVRSRIDAAPSNVTRLRPRRPALWIALAAAAAIAAAVLTPTLRPHPPAPARRSDVALAAFAPAEVEYRRAVDELRLTLRSKRTALSPQTVRVVEENLEIIDRSIARAKEALAADPGSRDLTFLLSSAYEMEIDLLRQATEI